MQATEGTLRLRLGRSAATGWRLGLLSELDAGAPPSASLPAATRLAELLAEQLDGVPVALAPEALFGVPTTAHILGGACMGAGPEEGVIDSEHRVFGYQRLLVVDGAAVSANPGVNPSLTIAALAERAMARIPAARRERMSAAAPRARGPRVALAQRAGTGAWRGGPQRPSAA
ncbi:MAG: hypothetical protein KatS3mg102_1679 [Planctomycetota bacterium]|nr:MAG: hypothetical protein KatS3mg102_1679 [Planctomycetota bacterium]